MSYEYETWVMDDGVTTTSDEIELQIEDKKVVVVVKPEDQPGTPNSRSLQTLAANDQGFDFFCFGDFDFVLFVRLKFLNF